MEYEYMIDNLLKEANNDNKEKKEISEKKENEVKDNIEEKTEKKTEEISNEEKKTMSEEENMVKSKNNEEDQLNDMELDENQLLEEEILAEYTKNLKLKEEKNEEINTSINKFPEIKNPLDFVEYIEKPNNKNIINLRKTFYLHQHILNEKINFNLLEVEYQNDLSNLIYSKFKDIEITTLIAKDEYIGIGDIYGNVNFYNYKNLKNHIPKIFKCPLSKTNFTQVTCMDLTPELDFLFVGYMNGSISMFEFNSEKNKFLSDKIHPNKDKEGKNPIIDIKLYNTANQTYEIISSDSLGDVKISVIKKEFYFKYSLIICENLIKRLNYPTFFIKTIDFSKENFPNFQNLGKYAIFGDLEIIRIFRMEPQTELVCYMIKPKYLLDAMIPDASIGIGKPIEKIDIFNRKEPENILLMAINWGTVIYIYQLIIKNNVISEGNLLGHYINNSIIQRLGFLTNSILYLYDKRHYLKILNTRNFDSGELVLSKDFLEPEIINNNELTELEDTIIEIKGQNYLKSGKGHSRETFIYSIIENNNILYLLGKNKITRISLLNWELCLNSFKVKNNWKDLLSVGIQIYQGKLSALADIPQEISERKKLIGDYLKQLISQYVISETKNSNSFLIEENIDNNKMKECIDITIEFCIEIESFDYLFKELEPVFENKNYSKVFLQDLEPYILSDKIIHFILDEQLVLKIINTYEEEKRLDKLNQLLIHINIKCLENETIKKKLEELNLITPLIYLYMNGKDENYFYPIEKLFELYCKSNSLENFSSYNLLKDVPLDKIINSKQFNGHKLLWYLNLCIEGRKFPNFEEKINEEKIKELIPKIIFWMFTEKNLYELCKFEPKYFFILLKKIFLNKQLYTILKDYDNDKENDEKKLNLMKLSNNISKIENANPKSLIEYLIKMIKNLKNDEILLYLYNFCLYISKNINFEKENIIEFSSFILNNYVKLMKEIDNEEIKELCINLKNIFESNYEFNEDEFIKILDNIHDNLFDEIKLYILKKLKNYSECLNVFINEKCGIEKREENLFNWLNMILTQLTTKKDNDKFSQMKELILKNINPIIQISVLKFKLFLFTWFPQEKYEVLHKISEPQLKLNFIELIIKDIKIELNDNELIEEDQLFIEQILKTHIELLCQLKLYDKILPSLKLLEIYPYELIIDTLEKHNVIQACIYVLLKTGDPKRAINICINNLRKYFEKIKNNLSSNNENSYDKNLKQFDFNIEQIYYVCKNNEQKINDLWKMFLMELYSINAELNKFENKNKQYKEFNQYLSKQISDLLDTMCNYVSIKKIIEIVSANYKDAEFKEFKAILLNMLDSNGTQETILTNAKKLLKNNILYREDLYKKLNSHGNNFTLNQCDECHKDFDKSINSKEKIIVFKCGHLLHDKCAIKNYSNEGEIVICSICRKNEIESSIDTQGLSSIKIDNTNYDEYIEDDDDIKLDYHVLRLYSQMKNMDRRHEEKVRIYVDE